MDAPSTIESTRTDVARTEPAEHDAALIELSAEELVAAEDSPRKDDETQSLEAVELELELHNQDLVSQGFEESIRVALRRIGGEILFQMRMENEDCQRVAAVRLGQERELALVIMPPDGGLMRVEPVAKSSNPLAMITESYAGLMDVFKAAA